MQIDIYYIISGSIFGFLFHHMIVIPIGYYLPRIVFWYKSDYIRLSAISALAFYACEVLMAYAFICIIVLSIIGLFTTLQFNPRNNILVYGFILGNIAYASMIAFNKRFNVKMNVAYIRLLRNYFTNKGNEYLVKLLFPDMYLLILGKTSEQHLLAESIFNMYLSYLDVLEKSDHFLLDPEEDLPATYEELKALIVTMAVCEYILRGQEDKERLGQYKVVYGALSNFAPRKYVNALDIARELTTKKGENYSNDSEIDKAVKNYLFASDHVAAKHDKLLKYYDEFECGYVYWKKWCEKYLPIN